MTWSLDQVLLRRANIAKFQKSVKIRGMQLSEILYQKTNDELYNLARLIDYSGPKRKDDLVGHIYQTLTRPESLRRLWGRLDPLSQKAVASAYHHNGEFRPTAFVAQYGSLPARPQSRWMAWYVEPILFDLFIYNGYLPEELIPLLAELAPPPERFQVQGLKNRPAPVYSDGHPISLIDAETEQAGLHDLTAYLRLVEQGQIKVSATTSRATKGSIQKIMDNLLEGGFFAFDEQFRAVDTIRPFGLDVFAQESGLVRARNGKTELTAAGRAFYQTQDPEILLEAFETWTEKGRFDELSRITALKGLNARGTMLTPPAKRREAVIEALSWCPAGVWIDIEDFYRAVKIWDFDFQVETGYYSNLYVGYKDYGSLYGETYWRIVKGLYINAVIFEILGSIGAVDLLYVSPDAAEFDLSFDFYYDEEYFSPYDGLKYFRINSLGAYLLGQAGEYVPAVPDAPPLFTISADKIVTLIAPDQMTPNDYSLLEQMAVPFKRGGYQLDTQQLLTSLEIGIDLNHLAAFLRSRHAGPLPEAVTAWLETVEQNSQAFKLAGEALMVRAQSAELVQEIMADAKLSKFTKKLDPKTVVIPANKERAFRQRLKELAYLLSP